MPIYNQLVCQYRWDLFHTPRIFQITKIWSFLSPTFSKTALVFTKNLFSIMSEAVDCNTENICEQNLRQLFTYNWYMTFHRISKISYITPTLQSRDISSYLQTLPISLCMLLSKTSQCLISSAVIWYSSLFRSFAFQSVLILYFFLL